MMRKVVLWWVFTLLVTGVSIAQESETEVVRIRFFRVPYVVTPQTFVDATITTLENSLEQAGYTPVTSESVYGEEYPPNFSTVPLISIIFHPTENFIRLGLFPVYSKLDLPSPIIEDSPNYGIQIIVQPDSPQEKAHAFNLMQGVMRYATGDCQRASVHFEDELNAGIVSSEAEVSHNWLKGTDIERYEAIRFLLATCALAAGNLEAAQAEYEAILSGTEKLTRHHSTSINLAWIYLQQGREEDAFRVMDQLVDEYRVNPDYQKNYTGLAAVLTKRSQLHALAFHFDEAIQDMDAAIANAEFRHEPDCDAVYPDCFHRSALAELYTERGQRILLTYEWDRVLADYNRAIEIDPEYAPAYFHRGVLFYTQGPRENALPDFRRYLELAPEGEFADEAARSIESIEAELEALNE